MARTVKRPYRKARRFSKGCRNHGSCSYCEGNRTHANAVREEAAGLPTGPCPDCRALGEYGVCDGHRGSLKRNLTDAESRAWWEALDESLKEKA